MKNHKYLLNTLLAIYLFAAMAAMMLIRVFNPAAVLPVLNIPNMVLLSLVVLLSEYYVGACEDRCYICITLFAFASFALLPLMAGFACQHNFWKIGLVGSVTFTATTWLFSSMTDRLSSGPEAKGTALMGAFGLYLAAQAFAGILL